MDQDLYDKFQKRLLSLHKGDQMTFQKHEDLLTQIIDAPLCKKCRKCYEQNPSCAHNMPHHKNIVKHNQKVEDVVVDGKRRCRYVLFQRWFDFLVNNRCLLESSPDYKDSLKRIMLSFHHQGVVSPNFEWHFWQLFQEHLGPKETRNNVISNNNNTSKSEKGNGFERFKEYYKEEEKKVLQEQRGTSNVTPLEFLIFFVGFYVEEYGFLCDKKVVTDLNMDTTLFDLCFDDVGKVNLYAAMHQRFLDEILNHFETGVIPFYAFDKCETVGDLFTLITKKNYY